jgi:hypothetical protein
MKNKLFSKLSLFLFFLIIFSTITTGYKQSFDNTYKGTQVKYDLLIITPQVFSEYLQPLVEHKNKHGVKTIISTTEEIYTQIYFKGRDDAEKVKYFIKEAIEQWDIKYVLLVGGRKDQSKTETWWIPVRYSNVIRDYKGYEDEAEGDFLTDLYFADIYDSHGNFSSWDNNDNGIFSEWHDHEIAEDIPYLYPDVAVGRLPCRNIADVIILVNKIISYETASFDDSWFKKMVVVAGDTYPIKTPDFIDGENHTQQAIDIMSDFEAVKIWSSMGNLKTHNIVKAINQGCGFIFFSGHGGANSWGTHPPNDIDNWIGHFKLKHMPFLFNKNKLPICLSASGCFNNMFNVSLSYSFLVYSNILRLIYFNSGIPRCWGWSMVANPFGGSIATIAATAYSYESSDIDSKRGGCEWLDIHFFEEYKQSNTKILGDCWTGTINRFLQNFSIDWSDNSTYGDAIIVKNVQQWLLIGDPSLKIGGYN